MNRMYARTASAPYSAIMSSGAMTLPFDLLLVSPCSSFTMPWHRRFANGSSKSTIPRSRSTFVKKRLYSKCRMACSMPPMYWSTGSQRFAFSGANGSSSLFGSV